MNCKHADNWRSEAEMALAFEKLLCSGVELSGLGAFPAVYREVSCRQGRPDFIGIKTQQAPLRGLSAVGLVGADVLGLLKKRAPRTRAFLRERLPYGEAAISASLRRLQLDGLIKVNESGSFLLDEAASFFDVEVVAFELKLNHARRALFQAKQSLSFADKAVIVVPESQLGSFKSHAISIQRWGIGIATFDAKSYEFALINKPRARKPRSRGFRAYALAKMYCM